MKKLLGALVLSGFTACGGSDAAPPSDEGSLGGSGGSGTILLDGNSGSGGASGSTGSGGSSGSSGGESGTGGSSAESATFALTLSVGDGGKVTSTPAGIACGSTCTASFPAGTQIQLAASEQGGVLTGWGAPCEGTGACSFTLQADTQVTANFAPFEVGANAHGVAITPDGAHALVTLGNSAGTLKIVSLSDGSIVDSIDVGSFPGAVAVTPDGSKAVVNNRNTASVVTLSTKAVATVASPCAGDTLYDVAITPDGTRAVTTMFQANCVTNSVAVIALDSASIENQYSIPAQLSSGIAVAADGASALVGLGILSTKVSRVALAGGAITDIPNTSSSFGIAVTPDGSEALVASGDGDTIKRIALASNTVTGSIAYAANQDPHNIAISPDGKLAVAAGSFDVGVLSLESGTVLKTFSGGGRSVAITPDGKRALVTLSSKLRVFSLQQ